MARGEPLADRLLDRTAALRLALERIGLPAWFVAVDLLWIAKPVVLGIDARHYQRASSTWLRGGDAWAVTEGGIPYAAGPHTLLFYLPTSWLPLTLATAIWVLVGLAAAVWLVRRLSLPVWWVLFPPLAHAIWNGNPQTVVLALLVAGGGLAGTVAAALKLYALLPLLFRPRQLIVAGLCLAVTLPLLPWADYLRHGFGASAMIGTGWNGSVWRLPILLPPTLLGLWLLRHRGAEWFAVPALVPGAQFYYVSTALPAVTGSRLLAALAAAPVPLMIPAIVIALAVRRLWINRRADVHTPVPRGLYDTGATAGRDPR